MVRDCGGARYGAGRHRWLGIIVAALVMGLIETSAWAQPGTPDIRGDYQGAGKISLSGCTNRMLNQSNVSFTPSMEVSQTGQDFTGESSGPLGNPANSATLEVQLTGTVTTSGAIPTSPFTFTIFQAGNPLASGSGTFTGEAGNNQITS